MKYTFILLCTTVLAAPRASFSSSNATIATPGVFHTSTFLASTAVNGSEPTTIPIYGRYARSVGDLRPSFPRNTAQELDEADDSVTATGLLKKLKGLKKPLLKGKLKGEQPAAPSPPVLAASPSSKGGKPYQSADSDCVNSPQNRKCWSPGYNIDTPTDVHWPDTGRTVHYFLDLREETMAPDGYPRKVRVFNNVMPGPTIEANWGDIIEVTVKNSLPRDGTSVHWHGVHQLDSNDMDGTNGLTECPLAPGEVKKYRFRATQYGTSWYHSHYSTQYSDGATGAIVIHGPTTANYDYDAGPVVLTDWYHRPSEEVSKEAEVRPLQPMPDNTLINGLQPSRYGGAFPIINLQPGKRNLLRFVNTGLDQSFHVSLDDHTFTVVAADFVPIVPFETKELVINVGQRYDVIVGGQGQSGNYWLRVTDGSSGLLVCDGGNQNPQPLAIAHYEGSPLYRPTSQGKLGKGCDDMQGLVPYRAINAPPGVPKELRQSFSQTEVTGGVVRWFIDFSAMVIDWRKPTLQYVLERSLDTLPRPYNLYPIGNSAEDWTYWVIQADESNPPRPHPIHLHGHDFLILAQGSGKYNGRVPLNFNNPTRRDTAMLPTAGFLVLAFQTNNPGAWLMHCHIPFHIAMGFGLQFLERGNDIAQVVSDGLPELQRGCNVWNEYTRRVGTLQIDSGL